MAKAKLNFSLWNPEPKPKAIWNLFSWVSMFNLRSKFCVWPHLWGMYAISVWRWWAPWAKVVDLGNRVKLVLASDTISGALDGKLDLCSNLGLLWKCWDMWPTKGVLRICGRFHAWTCSKRLIWCLCIIHEFPWCWVQGRYNQVGAFSWCNPSQIFRRKSLPQPQINWPYHFGVL